jgi:hypothetical protein
MNDDENHKPAIRLPLLVVLIVATSFWALLLWSIISWGDLHFGVAAIK